MFTMPLSSAASTGRCAQQRRTGERPATRTCYPPSVLELHDKRNSRLARTRRPIGHPEIATLRAAVDIGETDADDRIFRHALLDDHSAHQRERTIVPLLLRQPEIDRMITR